MQDDRLDFLRDALSGDTYSELEKKRLLGDLNTVCQRLKYREYQKSDFSGNQFNIPERTQEFYIYLEFYCMVAKVWKQVLEPLDIHRYASVADLCPGWTPKIELALFYLGYKGKVFVIDKDADSSDRVVKFMELFEPAYKIEKALLDVFENHGRQFEFVIANHIIDDLILGHFAEVFHIPIDDVYREEGVLKHLWDRILNDRDNHLRQVVPRIADAFLAITAPNGELLLSQYQSYIERLLELDEAVVFSRDALTEVSNILLKKGFVIPKKSNAMAGKLFAENFPHGICRILQRK